jgi:hypothetical protein
MLYQALVMERHLASLAMPPAPGRCIGGRSQCALVQLLLALRCGHGRPQPLDLQSALGHLSPRRRCLPLLAHLSVLLLRYARPSALGLQRKDACTAPVWCRVHNGTACDAAIHNLHTLRKASYTCWLLTCSEPLTASTMAEYPAQMSATGSPALRTAPPPALMLLFSINASNLITGSCAHLHWLPGWLVGANPQCAVFHPYVTTHQVLGALRSCVECSTEAISRGRCSLVLQIDTC